MKNKNKKNRIWTLFVLPAVLLVVFLFFSYSQASINKEINYQGKLTNNSDVAVSDGDYNMRFSLCTASDCSGGSDPIWTETHCFSPDSGSTCDGTGSDQRVAVENGIFSDMLGTANVLDSVDFNQTLYLEVQVGGSGSTPSWETLTPRKKLGAVPTAFEADQLDGLDTAESGADAHVVVTDSSGNLTISGNSYIAGNVGIGTTDPSTVLDVNGVITATGGNSTNWNTAYTHSQATSNVHGLTFTSEGSGGGLDADLLDGHDTAYFQTALTNPVTGTGTSGYLSKFTGASSIGNSLVYDNGTSVGIGTTDPQYFLDISKSANDNVGILIDNGSNSALGAAVVNMDSDSGRLSLGSYAGSYTGPGDAFSHWASRSVILSLNEGLDLVSGAGDMRFFTNGFLAGNETMRINSSGYVGIGTTDPSGKLHISTSSLGIAPNISADDLVIENADDSGLTILSNTDSNSRILFGDQNDNNIGGIFYDNDSDSLALYSNDATSGTLFINSSNYVGIGDNTPSYALDINGDLQVQGGELYLTGISSSASTTEGTIYYDTDDDNLYVYTSAGFVDLTVQGGGSSLWTDTASNIYANNATSVAITDTGRLGIGTTNPGNLLEILGTSTQLKLSYNATDNATFGVDDSGYLSISASGGYTKFNTSSVQNYLQVFDSTGADYIQLTHDGTNASITSNAGEIQLGTSGDFIIDSGVNVGIGTTDPAAFLDIAGSTTSYASLRLNSGSTPTSPAFGDIYANGSDIYFYNGSTWDDLTETGSGSLPSGTEGQMLYSNAGTWTAFSGMYWDDTDSYLGIGTTNPIAKVNISYTSTETLPTLVSAQGNNLIANPSSNSSALYAAFANEFSNSTAYDMDMVYGIYNVISNTGGGSIANGLFAQFNMVTHTDGGTIDNVYGTVNSLTNEATVGNFYNTFNDLSNSGTLTATYGNYVDLYSNTGTITDTYGFYVGDITAGTQTNTPYSFYASDANAYNYFAGNVGIGTTAPSAVLTLKAGTASAGTAPLKFTSGTNLGAAEAGAVEWDGTNLYITQTSGPTRKTIAFTDSFSSTYLLTGNSTQNGYFGNVYLDDTDASHHLILDAGSNLTSDRILTLTTGDAARTISLSGNLTVSSAATISGTNTGNQNIFQNIAVSGQSNVVADSTTDTLTLIAGSNITLATNATNDSVTITASGGTSLWTDTASNIYANNATSVAVTDTGRLGIGTTNPGAALEIGSGQVFLPDGSAGVPSLTFSNDSDLGFYNFGSGILGMSVAGELKHAFDSNYAYASEGFRFVDDIDTGIGRFSGGNVVTLMAYGEHRLTVNNDKIGIGTTAPDNLLEILGTSTQLKLSYNATDNATFGVDDSGYLSIGASGGYTKFNTSSVQNYLQIFDSTGADYIQLTHDGTNASISTNAGELQLGTSGDFIIDSGVNVGIGTTDPVYPLDVKGTIASDNYLRVTSWAGTYGAGYGSMWYDGEGGVGSSEAYIAFSASDGSTTSQGILRVFHNGSVGVGAAPSTKFGVAGLTGTSSYSLVRVNTSTGDFYYDSSSQRYKDNIEPLDDDFYKILDVEPKSFIDRASGNFEIGYIAEEFDALGLGNLVIYKDGIPDALKYDKVALYTNEIVKIHEEKINALTVSANKTVSLKGDLSQIGDNVTTQSQDVAILESQISNLDSRITNYELRITSIEDKIDQINDKLALLTAQNELNMTEIDLLKLLAGSNFYTSGLTIGKLAIEESEMEQGVLGFVYRITSEDLEANQNANGENIATDSTLQETEDGRFVAYGVKSTREEITVSGTGVLERNGDKVQSQIAFDATFRSLISEQMMPRVIITPAGPIKGLIYVALADKNGFKAEGQNIEDSGVPFNWIVIARRKGFENSESNNPFGYTAVAGEKGEDLTIQIESSAGQETSVGIESLPAINEGSDATSTIVDAQTYIPTDNEIVVSDLSQLQSVLSQKAQELSSSQTFSSGRFKLVDELGNSINFSQFSSSLGLGLTNDLSIQTSGIFRVHFSKETDNSIRLALEVDLNQEADPAVIISALSAMESQLVNNLKPLFLKDVAINSYTFNAGLYLGTQTRYCNVNTSLNYSVDYGLYYNQKLLIGTSQNSMRNLIDYVMN